MTNLHFFFPEQLGAALGWMVLHVLWQATLIGVVAGLALVAMRRGPARRRYWTANAALATILLAALGTFIYYYGSSMPAPAPGQPAAASAGLADTPSPAAPVARITTGVSAPDNEEPADYFNRNLPAVVALWFLGMSLFLLRLLGNIGYTYYLKTHLNFPTDPYWQELLDQLAQKSGFTKAVRLVESALVHTPMVAGHLKPVILFPIGMINRLDPREAEAILAHELAHILRHDYLFNILQSIVETLFYFHPAVWWLSGTIRQEREIAADDDAIRMTGNPVQYAKALVLVQDMAHMPASFSPAFSGPRKNRLLNRIQHVLNVQQSKNLAMEKFIGTCGILLIIIGIAYTQTTPPAKEPGRVAHPAGTTDGRSGAWQGTLQNDSVCMSLVSRTAQSSWMNGACFPVSEFSNLPTSDADFTLTRPAGTITWRGKFEGAEGYGRFKFTPDQSFADWLAGQGISGLDDDAMIFLFFANTGKEYVEFVKKAGFGKITGEELHRLALLEISRKEIQSYLDMNKDLGGPSLTIEDLTNFKLHDIDQAYVKMMLKTGFPNLTLDNIRDAKIHQITPEYIRQCHDLGFEKLSFDEVLSFKIHEITPEYIQECRKMGFAKLSADEVMNFKIHEITPAFLNEMKQIGFSDLSVDDAMSLKIHGVTRDYLLQLANAGFKNLSVDEVVSCRIHEVTAAGVQEFGKLGFSKITLDEAISLKIHEITPEFIQRMRDKGFKDLSLEEYIQLKIQYGNKLK